MRVVGVALLIGVVGLFLISCGSGKSPYDEDEGEGAAAGATQFKGEDEKGYHQGAGGSVTEKFTKPTTGGENWTEADEKARSKVQKMAYEAHKLYEQCMGQKTASGIVDTGLREQAISKYDEVMPIYLKLIEKFPKNASLNEEFKQVSYDRGVLAKER